MKSLLLALALLTSAVSAAQTVILIPDTAIRCRHTQSFGLRAITIQPDGSTTSSPSEFVIPDGYRLEVTDFSFAGYQPLDVALRTSSISLTVGKRSNSGSYVSLHTDFVPLSAMYGGNATTASSNLRTGQMTTTVAKHITFGTPFSFNNQARLCVDSSTEHLSGFASVQVVGRLVPITAGSGGGTGGGVLTDTVADKN